MKMIAWVLAVVLVGAGPLADSLAAEVSVAALQGQGKGKDQGNKGNDKGNKGNDKGQAKGQLQGQKGKDKGKGEGRAQGRNENDKGHAKGQLQGQLKKNGRGNSRVSRAELRTSIDKLPSAIRSLASDRRESHRFVAGAAARGVRHGAVPAALVVSMLDDGVRVSNRDGALLFDLNDDRARDLGAWNVVRIEDEPRGDGPAFCRSGAGHPVWGREWCIQKGFGLGDQDGRDWSRTTDVGDIIFGRRDDRDRLDRGSLIDVLGDIVFNRLALHALSLGFTEPLSGVWIAEPSSPRILRIGSGNYQVAELVDIDSNDRVDVLLIALPD